MSSYYNRLYSHPYQQNSAQQNTQQGAQQSSGYQPASASNAVPELSRSLPAVSSLSTEYTSYLAQSYGGQSNGWSSASGNQWDGSNSYSGPTDTSSRAAEALHDMSNTGYTPGNPQPVAQPTFNTTNYATNSANTGEPSHPPRYSANTRSPHLQSQQPYANANAYGQSKVRPPSINDGRTQAAAWREFPSQTIGSQQHLQQRSESPAQTLYQRRAAVPASAMKDSVVSTLETPQHSGESHRQPPNAQTSRTPPDFAPSKSSGFPNTHTVTRLPGSPIPPGPLNSALMPSAGQSTTTVDPLAVYDPWPEYERKQQAIRTQRAAEGAVRVAEQERLEQAREEEQRQLSEEEEEERARAAQSLAYHAPQATYQQIQNAPTAAETEDAPTDEAARLELEIRAMMGRMRELNARDPALLARIWEEERRARPTNPFAADKATSLPVASSSVQQDTPQSAQKHPKSKAAPRSQSTAASVKPATPVLDAILSRPPQAGPARPSGNTIWPSDQRISLANAVSTYLDINNPGRSFKPEQILRMLNGNPSYIELCEQLEAMWLILDRAAFAKALLAAAPDVNSVPRKVVVPQPAPQPATPRVQAPPTVMKNVAPPPAAFNPNHAPPTAILVQQTSYPLFPGNTSATPTAASSAPVAEAVRMKPEPEPPTTKEEAARKRNLSDLIDLTQLSDEEMGPPLRKKPNSNHNFAQSSHFGDDAMQVDLAPVTNNFPSANVPARALPMLAPTQPAQIPQGELRYRSVVKALDKRKALRRNTYNPATIARDVLVACGRHPFERQLNQHLDVLKARIMQISNESDLSTLDWDLIDPGNPPPGYFRSSVQTLTENADDEEGSENESRGAHRQSSTQVIGTEVASHALPEAVNPFKRKRQPGRPPRHSLPNSTAPASPTTPTRASSTVSMSASAPSPTSGSIGYQAFRSVTQYGPDGTPLPKKKGRPVGWRKAIHGSAAANNQAGISTPQPSSLREYPIRIASRSPTVADPEPKLKSFKCKWQGCKAELHNLETLRLHLFKIHSKRTPHNTIDCMWDGCGQTNFDPSPSSIGTDSTWREHVQLYHIDPLSWKLGDGPASGLSDAYSSEAYLSDAQGRRLTPRITAGFKEHLEGAAPSPSLTSKPRSRGRSPKNSQEQDARDTQDRLTSRKKRLGGPGMDRGGATLVNDKRRRGLVDSDWTVEELVDAEY